MFCIIRPATPLKSSVLDHSVPVAFPSAPESCSNKTLVDSSDKRSLFCHYRVNALREATLVRTLCGISQQLGPTLIFQGSSTSESPSRLLFPLISRAPFFPSMLFPGLNISVPWRTSLLPTSFLSIFFYFVSILGDSVTKEGKGNEARQSWSLGKAPSHFLMCVLDTSACFVPWCVCVCLPT